MVVGHSNKALSDTWSIDAEGGTTGFGYILTGIQFCDKRRKEDLVSEMGKEFGKFVLKRIDNLMISE